MLARASLLGATLATAALTLGAACTVGAPPGFSSGDSWSFPLVGPLEDGVLLVPVTVEGKGPFLFALDPDAPMTSIDASLASELDLYGGIGGRLFDESDTSRPIKVAEVHALRLGTLTVRNRMVAVHGDGTYRAAGRVLTGIIGRDILAESLVFAFDRDAGLAFLATRDVFTAPEPALQLKYRDTPLKTGLVEVAGTTRRLVSATINGASYDLHVDLGGFQSQLRADLWTAAHLTPLPYRATLVDEVGTPRTVDKGGIANQIAVGPASAMGVLMVPYGDKRTDPESVDGALGLNFFAPYAVWADWNERTLYLRPRDPEDDKLAVRLGRWASPELAACARPACVTESKLTPGPADPDGEAPVDVTISRDASARDLTYEVTLEAVGEDRHPLGLPRLIATFPRGVTTLRQKVSPAFAGAAALRVLDVSPFVRPCPQDGGCVLELALAR